MKKLILLLALQTVHAADWPQWRGPNRDNHAAADAKPVTEWSEEKNVRWKTPISGRGHSSPIVVDGQIYLTTGDKEKETQSLIAIERATGKILWEKVIHQGGLAAKVHNENSHASPSVLWDGKKLLVTFQNEEQIKVTAVDTKGKILWSKAVGPYKPHYAFGYGASPALHQGNFIVSSDTQDGGFITAIDADTGEAKWKIPRSGHDNWATPVVAKVSGKEQLLISGIGKISSYDPANGKLNWAAPLEPQSTCGTVVWTEDMVFASGGFPKNATAGIKADGSGEVVWKNRERCYEQSLLSHKGLIYAVTDKGFAFCWDAKTGEKKWNHRLGRGGVMASPVVAGDLIFATIKVGQTTIFKATGKGFEKVAENQLGDDTYATPVIVDDEIFMRVGQVKEGSRQEMLYCLGEK